MLNGMSIKILSLHTMHTLPEGKLKAINFPNDEIGI